MVTIPGGCQNAEPSENRVPWRFRAEDSAGPALLKTACDLRVCRVIMDRLEVLGFDDETLEPWIGV